MEIRAKWALMGVVFGIGAGAVVVPGTAWAFECGIDGPRIPVDGDVDIPTNALLWSYSSRNARLEGPTGEPVATDDRSVNVLVGIALGVLAPRAPLEPNTDYSIVIDDGEEYPIRRVRFRTAAGPTTTAPEPPVFRASEPRTGSREFGPSRSQMLEFEALPASQFFLGDHTLPDAPPAWAQPDDLTSFVDLVPDGDAAGDDDPDQTVVDGRPIGWISTQARFSVGVTDCGFWPNGGDRQDLRFAAVDVAGHVSAWTEIGTIEIPSREEAQLAYDARSEAAARHNIQGPRACSMPPSLGRARSASGACLMFGLGLAIAARRRAARG